MSAKQLRDFLRYSHIVLGLILGTYIYSPLFSEPVFLVAMRFFVIPFLTISGLWMWQMPLVRKWRRRMKSSV
jgi:hypothetical protein